jgi:hypothetical protein
MTTTNQITIAKARKAALAVKKITKRSVTIKTVDGVFELCIGWTDDRTGDRAFYAARKAAPGIAMSADTTGFGEPALNSL